MHGALAYMTAITTTPEKVLRVPRLVNITYSLALQVPPPREHLIQGLGLCRYPLAVSCTVCSTNQVILQLHLHVTLCFAD